VQAFDSPIGLIGHEPSMGEIELVDKDLEEFIKYLDTHFSHNTIVILMGDHGPRYGAYRQTLHGKLEERTPVLWMLVPPSLSTKFPDLGKNLETNQRRLVTAFDIHETLKDIMSLHQSSDAAPFSVQENRGMSILRPIPKNRTCEDAGIAAHWCACMSWAAVSLEQDDKVQSIAKYIVDRFVLHALFYLSLRVRT
jgi:hypothetical protein